MAFRHGKDTVVFGDDAALTGQLNQFSATRSQQVVSTNVFGTSDQEFIAGMYESSLSVNGLWEAATSDTELWGHATANVILPVTVGHGDTLGNRAILFNGFLDDYSIQGPVNDAVRLSATFTGSAATRLGVNLHPLGAETTTGAESSVDQGASSANGGVANLHVTAFTGTDCTIKIQDSANDADWADLITFTTVSGVTSERATVTGTVDQYVRVNITAGTFSSVTFAVAFARNWD